VRFLRAFQKRTPCSHRNVSCECHKYEVARKCMNSKESLSLYPVAHCSVVGLLTVQFNVYRASDNAVSTRFCGAPSCILDCCSFAAVLRGICAGSEKKKESILSGIGCFGRHYDQHALMTLTQLISISVTKSPRWGVTRLHFKNFSCSKSFR